MKYYHFLFLIPLFCAVPQLSFTQDQNKDTRLILRNSAFFSKYWYQFPNGMPISYKDVRAMISLDPSSESLLKQEKGWRTATYALAGILVVSLGTLITYELADLPQTNTIIPICAATCLISFTFNVLAGKVADIKLQRSVDNYNLSLMGVPIK